MDEQCGDICPHPWPPPLVDQPAIHLYTRSLNNAAPSCRERNLANSLMTDFDDVNISRGLLTAR